MSKSISMIAQGPTVKDLKQLLEGLDDNLIVCGYASDESTSILHEACIKQVGEWHDSLPEGTSFLQLYFRGSMKHDK